MSRNYSSYQKTLNSFFDFNEGTKANNLSVEFLKKSKKLILDNITYSNYSSYYNKLTMIHSFKLPGVQDYPIRTNKGIIPIKQYNKISLYKEDNNNNIFKGKTEKKNRNVKSAIQHLPSIKDDNSINSKSFLIYIDKFNNMDGAIHKYITYKETYFVNKNNDGNKKLLSLYSNKNYYNDVTLNPFEDNPIFKKENIFKIKDTEVKLRCDSLVLIFFDEDGKKNSKIKFPFNLIPFFYGIDFDSFKLFFFSVVDYNYKKNKFKLNDKKFNTVFNSHLSNNKLYGLDCFLDNYSQIPSFKYDWIVNKDNTIKKYKFKIKMPKIKVRFKYSNGFKTSLIKSLDSTHMSYLVLENFKDWDLFLLNSFCIIKEFRKTINQSLSYSPIKNNKNIKIDLDDIKIKINKKSYSKYSSVFFITLYEDLGGKNYFFEIKSPKIKIEYKGEGFKTYEKIYELNLKEAIQLNKMRKSFWPEDMINRCLTIQERKKKNNKIIETKLELDKKIFDFDNDLLKFIKRQDNFLNEIIINKSLLKINLLLPSILWHSSNELFQLYYNLERNEFEELFELPMINWYDYIIRNFPKIKELSSNRIEKEKNKKKTTVENLLEKPVRNFGRKKSIRSSLIIPSFPEKILDGK